jgi:c-di-GMP-related signal transduction protein
MMSKREVIATLKVLTKTLENLNEKEFNSLLKGQGNLVFKTCKVVPETKVARDYQDKYIQLANLLKEAKTREDAVKLIEQNIKLKAGLIQMAKHLKVYVAKSDTKDILKEKIVEVAVGSKLRAKAIEDTDLKGTNQ